MLDVLKDYVAEKVAQISAGPKNAVAMYANHALGAIEWADWRQPDACEVLGLMRNWVQSAERERLNRGNVGEPANREYARAVASARSAVVEAIRDYVGGDVPF